MSQALTPQYGGSAFSEASLSGSLVRSDNDVTVLCRRGAFDPEFVRRFGRIPVEGYGQFEWLSAWLSSSHRLRAMIRSSDVVHINGHWRWENYFVARICVSEKKPYLLQPRGMLWLGHRRIWLKKVFQRLIGGFIIRNAQKLVALSVFELEQWKPYAIADARLQVLPNGVVGGEGNGENRGEKNADAKAAQGLSAELPQASHGYFLYLGRLESRKNLFFLIDSYRSYRRRGGKSELWLVGPAERGYDESLRKYILKLGLVSHVRLLPPVFTSGKSELMKGSLALVYPAVEEPFGRVPFEALDAGAFPIVPRRSGSAEYIRAFLPDAIYEDGRVESLAQILFLVGRPDNDRTARLEKAQAWVRKELHWNRMTERYQDLYRSVIRNTNRENDRGDRQKAL